MATIFHSINQKYLKISKAISDTLPFFFKSVPQHGTNMYTGLKLTGKATALGISALSLYAIGRSARNVVEYKRDMAMGTATPVGILPAMRYVQPTTGRDLGATGDLVFGLHNLRRG